MSEWNVIHENVHTKHSVFTAPDAHMHTSLCYTLWAYNQQLRQSNIWSVHITSIGKENRSSEWLSYKEHKGERGTGHPHKQSEGLGGVLWMYKAGLKWPVIAMAITRKPHCLSVSLPSSITSQSILCNYFKVCTKFSLKGAEWLTRSDCQR